MSLPVSPSNYIYSHFKHISGVPAPEGIQGVSITRLKILDVLIEQLSQIKRQGDTNLRPTGPMSDDQIDALIEQYEGQIRQAKAASTAAPYKPAPAAPMGALFSFTS
jgi:hypothetical protein